MDAYAAVAPAADRSLLPQCSWLILTYLVEVLSHSKEKSSHIRTITTSLVELFKKSVEACKNVFDLLSSDKRWLREMLFSCSYSEVRLEFAHIITSIMDVLCPVESCSYLDADPSYGLQSSMEVSSSPESSWGRDAMSGKQKAATQEVSHGPSPMRSKSSVARLVDALLDMLEEAPGFWRNFEQYFAILNHFAQIGMKEREFLLARGALSRMIEFFVGDDSPNIKAHQHKQKRTKMGDKHNAPNVVPMLETISILTTSCHIGARPLPPNAKGEDLLPVSEQDMETLLCMEFYSKSLKGKSNFAAISEIVTYLCYENMAVSNKFLKMIMRMIHAKEHYKLRPFFETLSIILDIPDSLQDARVHSALGDFLEEIHSNSKWVMATLECVTYLSDLVRCNACARAFMLDAKERWLLKWLVDGATHSIREATLALVQALLPGYAEQMVVNGNADGVPPPDDLQDAEDIYDLLLAHLPHAANACVATDLSKDKSSPEETVFWRFRLVPYLKLLRWLVQAGMDRLKFTPFFNAFWDLFLQIENIHIDMDENKKELVAFWNEVCTDCPDNVRLITGNAQLHNAIMDFYVSIRPTEQSKQYNIASLPYFYGLLYKCCRADPKFLQFCVCHQNFHWATQHILLTNQYPDVATIIRNIICLTSEDQGLRHTLIKKWCHDNENILVRKTNGALLFDTLILDDCPEDSFLFCRNKGLIILSNLATCCERDLNSEAVGRVGRVCRLFVKVLDTITGSEDMDYDALQGWDENAMMSVLKEVVAWLNTYYTMEKIVLKCYDLARHICQLSTYCLSALVKYYCEDYRMLECSPSDIMDTDTKHVAPPPTYSLGTKPKCLLHCEAIKSEHMHGDPASLHNTRMHYYRFMATIAYMGLDQPTSETDEINRTLAADLVFALLIEAANFPSAHTLAVVTLKPLITSNSKAKPLLVGSQYLTWYLTKVLTTSTNVLCDKDSINFVLGLFNLVHANIDNGRIRMIYSYLLELVRLYMGDIRATLLRGDEDRAKLILTLQSLEQVIFALHATEAHAASTRIVQANAGVFGKLSSVLSDVPESVLSGVSPSLTDLVDLVNDLLTRNGCVAVADKK
mmetsp:Transcript_9290/g.23283  ORF Transcript_9290/g.23283 Transcript_9290/m.23283 type:complete len:1090 (-) Transcript_9290:298-3567(-)